MAEIDRILVGGSAAMRAVRARVAGLAGVSSPVLVRGERGTGKGAVARALHAAGARCEGPLVVLDCGDGPDAALALALAGDGGASSSACRAGMVERSAGGTLVVREVAAAGPAVQAALLAAVREPSRDVRLVATTAHDLRRLADDGDFSADLLDALAGDAIVVPPLRERIEDVPELCQHFLSRAGRRERRHPQPPDGATLALFHRYAWRRNVRELKDVVERACTVDGSDHPLRLEVVEPWLGAAATATVAATDPAVATDAVAATVEALAGKPLADIEKQVILSTLQQFRGHRIKTAGALGIGVRTLGIKLKRWRDEGEPVDGRTRRAD